MIAPASPYLWGRLLTPPVRYKAAHQLSDLNSWKNYLAREQRQDKSGNTLREQWRNYLLGRFNIFSETSSTLGTDNNLCICHVCVSKISNQWPLKAKHTFCYGFDNVFQFDSLSVSFAMNFNWIFSRHILKFFFFFSHTANRTGVRQLNFSFASRHF